MATSLNLGSDETFLHVCDICLEDDRNVEAVALCSVCDQYFCVTCKTVHERSKSSNSHVLVTGDNLKKTISSSRKILCRKHGPDEEVKYFCLSHEVPCCEKCKLIDHRGCKHVESLTHIAAKRNPKKVGNELLIKTKRLEAEIESLKSRFETNLSKLEEQQQSMIETIHEERRRLDTVLDEWENKSVKEIEDTCAKESRVSNDNVSICSEIEPEVKTSIKKIQQALEKSDEECFIEMTEIQKDKNKYNDIFREMNKVSFKIEMKLEKEETVEMIKSQLKDSNKIEVRYYKDRNALPSFSTRPYKDRVAHDAGEINVALPADVETPGIAGIEVLHGRNNILFLENSNNKLKLFDVGNGSWTENKLSSTPYRMCKTDVQNEVLVTLPNTKCLQLFRINKTGQIMTDLMYKTEQRTLYNITKHQNDFITQSISISEWIFDVTSKNGQVIRIIRNEPKPSKLFKFTPYLAVDSHAEIFYVTDDTYGCTGLSMTGDVVFRYNDKLIKGYCGVTTDPDGNVYISGTESNNVVMVNSKGETIKVLLNDIEQPRYIKYDEPTNTLFVFLKGSPVVKMFHLM